MKVTEDTRDSCGYDIKYQQVTSSIVYTIAQLCMLYSQSCRIERLNVLLQVLAATDADADEEGAVQTKSSGKHGQVCMYVVDDFVL